MHSCSGGSYLEEKKWGPAHINLAIPVLAPLYLKKMWFKSIWWSLRYYSLRNMTLIYTFKVSWCDAFIVSLSSIISEMCDVLRRDIVKYILNVILSGMCSQCCPSRIIGVTWSYLLPPGMSFAAAFNSRYWWPLWKSIAEIGSWAYKALDRHLNRISIGSKQRQLLLRQSW